MRFHSFYARSFRRKQIEWVRGIKVLFDDSSLYVIPNSPLTFWKKNLVVNHVSLETFFVHPFDCMSLREWTLHQQQNELTEVYSCVRGDDVPAKLALYPSNSQSKPYAYRKVREWFSTSNIMFVG